MFPKPNDLQPEQTELLAALGQRLRLARLRRQLTAQHVADKAGITRMTLYRLERGEPTVSLGNAIKVMGVLDLQGSFNGLGAGDSVGHELQDENLARRHPPARQQIRIDRYPQLKQLAWNVAPESEISVQDAFALYERNWRHVDEAAMPPRERQLVRRLIRTVGHGVMLV